MLILMECVWDIVCFDLFLVTDRLLQAYQFFLIAHQHLVLLSVLLSDGQNLSWF